MPFEPNAAAIAHRIRDILARGLRLSPDTLRFIDSTFADLSAAELAAILSAELDSEKESLLELLFSPDEALQLELEELLKEQAPGEIDEDEMVAILCRPPLSVEIHLSENKGTIYLALTPDLIQRFLGRLRIGRLLPMPVAAAIVTRLKACDQLRLRVLLRGARFDFSPSKNDFLCRLIERLDWDDPNTWETFAFGLELLASMAADTDIGQTLRQWKKLLLNALNHARRQREQLAAANIETLLSQGQRLTHVDEAAVQGQLASIDRICLAAFGQIIQLDSETPGEAVSFSGLPDIPDMIRRLM